MGEILTGGTELFEPFPRAHNTGACLLLMFEITTASVCMPFCGWKIKRMREKSAIGSLREKHVRVRNIVVSVYMRTYTGQSIT